MINKIIAILIMVSSLGLMACQEESPKSTVAIPQSTQVAPTVKSFESFSGTLLDGNKFEGSAFEGQRLLVGFFSHRHKDALAMINALRKLRSYEKDFNFKIILVSIDYDYKEALQKFITDNKIEFPIILETSALALAEKFSIEYEVAVVGLSTQHKLAFGVKSYAFPHTPEGEKVFLDYMKESLSIPQYSATLPHFGIYPVAPDFSVKTFSGKTFKLSDYKGKVVQIVFFSPKCPHCQKEISFLREEIYPEFKDKGLEILAVSALALKDDVLKLYQSFKAEWPVAEDVDRSLRKLFSSESGVPENFVIDREGRIRYHASGYSEYKKDDYKVLFKSLLGLKVEAKLSDSHFSGVESCANCHQKEYASWSVTGHAKAWQSLAVKGETGNPKCVACHTVGFDDPKGYKPIKSKNSDEEIVRVAPLFQDVSCENCHGQGGPHLATNPKKVDRAMMKTLCLKCHTPEWSPNFNVDEAIKKVNHSQAAHVMGLSLDERIKLLESK